jgi:hypothetical protein
MRDSTDTHLPAVRPTAPGAHGAAPDAVQCVREGAREQIANRLKERGWTTEQEIFQVASYLAGVTLEAIGRLYTNAKQVQPCAKPMRFSVKGS